MKIRLTKIAEVENPMHPLNIEVGYVKDGYFIKPPVIGERFWVGYSWSTSVVTEIINDNTFRTLNSIYQWEEIKNE